MVEDNLVDLIGFVEGGSFRIYDVFGQYIKSSIDGGLEFDVLKGSISNKVQTLVYNTGLRVKKYG